MSKALEIQHGGSHYKDKAIQPIQLGMANNYDPCIFSAIKYVTRHADKAGKLDLNKALHFCQLRLETGKDYPPPPCRNTIPIHDYIVANAVPELEAAVLVNLHHWGLGENQPSYRARLNDDQVCAMLVNQITILSQIRYPETEESK